MKYLFSILFLAIGFNSYCFSNTDTLNQNPNYDSVLAKKLNADDYGMKSYFLVILKSGKNNTLSKEEINENLKGHMENIGRLVDEGKLVVAGPLGKNDNQYRGIFILQNVKSIKEAQEILQTDPAIESGIFDYEIYTWYGSAALSEYLPYSDKIWKRNP